MSMQISGHAQVDFSAQAEELTNTAAPGMMQQIQQFATQIESALGGALQAAGKGLTQAGNILNPGNLASPNQANAPAGGYAPGKADGPSDTGNVGQTGGSDPSQAADPNAPADGTSPTPPSGGDDIASIMKGSFPGNILRLLAKLAQDAQGVVEAKGKKLAAGMEGGADAKGTTKSIGQENQQDLQQASSNLSDLRNLLSTLTKDMHDIDAAIIRNT